MLAVARSGDYSAVAMWSSNPHDVESPLCAAAIPVAVPTVLSVTMAVGALLAS